MAVPRFRLQTLMLVVAVAAVECWVALSIHWFIAIVSIGPLAGVLRECNRSRPRLLGFLLGGVRGGLLTAAVGFPVVALLILVLFGEAIVNSPDSTLPLVLIVLACLLATSLGAGLIIGLLAQVGSLALKRFLAWIPSPIAADDPVDQGSDRSVSRRRSSPLASDLGSDKIGATATSR